MANKGMPTRKKTSNRDMLEKINTIENTLQAEIKIVEARVSELDPVTLREKHTLLQKQIEDIQQALIRVVNQWDYQLNYHRNALAEVIGRVDLITNAIGEEVPPAEEQAAIFPMKEEVPEKETPAPDEEASQPPPSE